MFEHSRLTAIPLQLLSVTSSRRSTTFIVENAWGHRPVMTSRGAETSTHAVSPSNLIRDTLVFTPLQPAPHSQQAHLNSPQPSQHARVEPIVPAVAFIGQPRFARIGHNHIMSLGLGAVASLAIMLPFSEAPISLIEQLSSQPTKNAPFSRQCCSESTRRGAPFVPLTIAEVVRRLGRHLCDSPENIPAESRRVQEAQQLSR